MGWGGLDDLATNSRKRLAVILPCNQEATQAEIVQRALESTHEELQRLSGVANGLNGGLERLASGGKRTAGGTQGSPRRRVVW